jgi:opacity protein-like surface antigen
MKGLMLAVLCALALLVPVAAADAASASGSQKGRVTVGAKITRFAVADRKIVARGTLTTRVSGSDQSQAARTPVTFAVVAQAGRCSVLTLNLQGLDLTLLGLNVNLSEVNLLIYAQRNGGVLGRLFCALSRTQLRLGRGATAASAHKVVRALNSQLRDRPMRVFQGSAVLAADEGASAAQAPATCEVLRLVLGPLRLNLLGLVVELFGPNRQSPVTLTITGIRGGGILGDLFCGLTGP